MSITGPVIRMNMLWNSLGQDVTAKVAFVKFAEYIIPVENLLVNVSNVKTCVTLALSTCSFQKVVL